MELDEDNKSTEGDEIIGVLTYVFHFNMLPDTFILKDLSKCGRNTTLQIFKFWKDHFMAKEYKRWVVDNHTYTLMMVTQESISWGVEVIEKGLIYVGASK